MVLGAVTGWVSVGFIARCYQLGIQKRHPFENFGGHAAYMASFGLIGYYLHGLKHKQEAMLQERSEQILANRQRQADRVAAKQAQLETAQE